MTTEVIIELIGQDTQVKQTIVAQTVEGFTKGCYLTDWSVERKKYSHLQNISMPKPPYPTLGTLLIGCDNPFLFDVFDKRVGSNTEPRANKTLLGWSFFGPKRVDAVEENLDAVDEKFENQFFSNGNTISFSIANGCPAYKSHDDFLADIVERQFELEEFGLQENEEPFSKGFSGGPKDPVNWSPNELKADDKMTVKHDEDNNTFEVKIPWFDGYEDKLANNFYAVKQRQERSHTQQYLAKKGVELHEIDTIINGYLDKKYIEPVPLKEQGQGWYLPFFEVVCRHKSTPIRLVFDAKAEYNKVSLNSQIEDTPNRLNDLVLTMLRLRRFEFALTADISEMFLRIRLVPEDRKYHRFYHKGTHYQWTRILFGNKCSPNASQKVLDTLCKANIIKFPEACYTVKNSCYMDDCADSMSSEHKLIKLAKQLPELLKLADMRLCKFYTNSKLVAKSLPRDLLAKEISFDDKEPLFDYNKVLGMIWEADPDFFTFATKYKTVLEWKEACKVLIWTKRAVLKTTASTFDPLGLLSPIIMYPRTIIQELWALELDWDDPINENLSNKWEECLENILKVYLIRFPRWIGDFENSDIELHIFCDASEKAFAATVYSRVTSRGGEISTNLIMAKSRVSPLKNESVARLELVACVIGTRLLKAVNQAYKIPKENIYFYTDSRNALCWINTPSHKAKTYVYNRTAEVQRTSKLTQWGHVPTDVNPADIATRFITTEDLRDNNIWFEGPPFLRDKTYTFNHYITKPEDLTKDGLAELKTLTTKMVKIPVVTYFQFAVKNLNFWHDEFDKLSVGKHYNTFSKYKRFLQKILIGLEKWSKRKFKSNTFSQMIKVNNFVYRTSQQKTFSKEIELLRKGKKIQSNYLIAKYFPFIDEFGIIRSNSRLSELDFLAEETRRPVILLGTDYITRLIAYEVHWQFAHSFLTI